MRWIHALLVLVLAASALIGQEHPPEAEAHAPEAAHGDGSWTLWKWANFAILMAALGFLAAKHGGPFFRGRSEEIRKGIADAAAEKQAADARFADVERRLKNLDSEIAALRSGSREEMKAESERLRLETTSLLAKVHMHAEQEIASLGKAARQDLRNYAAALAIELAERRIRERITPQVHAGLISKFAEGMQDGGRR